MKGVYGHGGVLLDQTSLGLVKRGACNVERALSLCEIPQANHSMTKITLCQCHQVFISSGNAGGLHPCG